MWSQILLCLLVGLAYASNPGWQQNQEYVYQIRARSLASLNQVSNDYSGFVIKAKLTVRPKSEDLLEARISEPEYAPVHTKLEGWQAEIPDGHLSLKHLPISQKPFHIVMQNGVCRDVIVGKATPNWEANLIKSVVSSIQLDTQNENLMSSHFNTLPQEDSNTGVFKTMEESVTGFAETLYEIHYMPEYQLQSEPWLVPNPELKGSGDIYEVLKTKNHTRAQQRPAYHFGFSSTDDFEPTGNQVEEFFTRLITTRAMISGSLERFIVQSSVTTDEIQMNPSISDKQQGSANTMINITLMSTHQTREQFEQLIDPVSVSLVYAFNQPFDSSNQARQGEQNDHTAVGGSSESENWAEQPDNTIRSKRGNYAGRDVLGQHFGPWSTQMSGDQDTPELSKAPESPLLPFTVGYGGQSLKKQQNVIENVRKLAQQISKEIQKPDAIPRQQTLGKFVILTSLVRIMNKNEIQQVASQLYTAQQQETQGSAWATYRDAVGQSGTGPALQSLQEWISTSKIQGQEAAQLVASAAYAARQPTTEYMKAFFQLVRSEQTSQQSYLNETALLAFTKLAHQVYVDTEASHNKHPVHSFASFRTKEGFNYLKKEVIPYLTQQLHEAIEDADTSSIHVYIRALGNVGDQSILEAFEPYLEGEKKASHFERVLMVVALDKLATANPKVATSVLFKIYRNPSEFDQVRVAAVYQLMRANPTPEILQRMATYTNYDASEYVNAAVKSVIENAAQLQGPALAQFRSAAQTAEPLLTTKEYGTQYSSANLRSYLVDETNQAYKQGFKTYGASDSFAPNGIDYLLQKSNNGISQILVNGYAMVSSIDDLLNVVEQQTEEYQEHLQRKSSNTNDKKQWSPINIANLLNMENEQREKLEGNMYLEVGALQRILSFDNQTIEDLPYVLRKVEEALKSGQDFSYEKWMIPHELALAFPTALGMPFVYVYDNPTFISLQGKVRASANPSISSGDKLRKPQTIESEYEISVLIAGRSQSQLSIITPFDSQRYSAGYDKNFQVNVPLSGKVTVDMQQQQLHAEIQPFGEQQNTDIFHFSSWPYTAKDNIYSPEPNKRIIRNKYPQQINTVLGKASTGIAFNIEASIDNPLDLATVYEKLQRHDSVSALLSPWIDENIQHAEITVSVDSAKTSTNKVVVRLGYQQHYQQNRQAQDSTGAQISKFDEISEEPLKRQSEFMKRASADINNVRAQVFDASIKFQGQQEFQYVATLSTAKSNVDPKSRVLFQLKKKGGQGKQWNAYASAKTHSPNTNGLNMAAAMRINAAITTQIEASLGENWQSSAKFNAKIEHQKSQQRQEYLKTLPEYEQCQREMQQGNQQLSACAKMTAIANLLDKFSAVIEYKNVESSTLNYTYKVYSLARHALFPTVEENMFNPDAIQQDQVQIEGQFHPDLEAVNVTIRTKHVQVYINSAKVHPLAQQLLVPHPVFHAKARVVGTLYGYEAYRPFCVVDQQAANTFDNKTYPAQLSSAWTVLLHYTPRRPAQLQRGQRQESQQDQSVEDQLINSVENYAVLARSVQGGSYQKEVKVVVESPETKGKLVEITFKSSGSQGSPKIYINSEEIRYSTEQGADLYDGYMQVYGLPNNEVKFELNKAFYVIYDGKRVKLTATSDKFNDATRGLCGTFTGEPQTDFLSPENCILASPEEFVASYVVPENGQQRLQRANLRQGSQSGQCYAKEVKYANVISAIDTGAAKSGSGSTTHGRPGSCTKLQTQFSLEDDEICFTIRAVPVCKPGCQSRGSTSKQVAVHCVQQSSATRLWQRQIEKGASPDFSAKSPSKTIQMEVPQSCSS